jgi:hypothetical protein
MLGYWSTGILGFKYITPILQYSNTSVSSSRNRL